MIGLEPVRTRHVNNVWHCIVIELRVLCNFVVALPVGAEGAGTQGGGHLGGWQPHMQGHLQLAGQLVQGGHRGRQLRIRQFHKLEFLEAEINVFVDEFSFSEIVALVSSFWFGFGLGFFVKYCLHAWCRHSSEEKYSLDRGICMHYEHNQVLGTTRNVTT